jgi:hypothetical protein
MGEDHWHYASDIHGGAEQHHRHYDLENETGAVERRLREEVRELRGLLDNALERIAALEKSTPEARQAQAEADTAMADLRASGWSEYEDERP